MKKSYFIIISLLLLLSLASCNHEHEFESIVVNPTCTTKGYILHSCNCGETYQDNYTEMLDHEYGEFVVVTEPTYESEGLKEKTCTACGSKITEKIPSLTHTHEYSSEVINPTCTTKGYTLHSCNCGETYQDNYTEMLTHEYGEFVVVTEPTYESEGLKEKTCTLCGNKISEKIPSLTHTHEYISEVINPTCTTKGYTLHSCNCGETYQDNYTDMLAHEYEKEVLEATCNAGGYTTYTCKNCDDNYIGDFTSQKTHEYEKEVLEATCIAGGYTTYTCKNCDDNYVSDYTDKLEHSYGEWEIIKTPTINTEGLKEKTCNKCSTKITETIPVISAPTEVQITYDLNGGLFNNGYTSMESLVNDFLKDYNKYSSTDATLSNFLKDSTSTVKEALSNSEMLKKWQWLFSYMYDDVKAYNDANKTSSIGYVADSLALFPKLIALDTSVIKDSSKGPNFRTLVRSYLHGMMNSSKGDPVGNSTFALYVPDFSIEDNNYNLLLSQYDLNVTFNTSNALPTPVREYHKFIGWTDEKGNIITTPTENMTLKAKWEEGTPVENIKITNKINTLDIYSTYQLTWEITPSDAVNKKVKFESSDSSIASITSSGLIETNKTGTVTIKIISLANGNKSDSFTLKVEAPGYFDISYATNSFVTIDSVIKLNASYIDSLGKKNGVSWSSLNKDIAFVDNDGLVTGLKEGVAYIRASYNDTKYQDFLVTVVSKEVSVALQTVLDAHVSNVFVEYNLGIGAGTPVYYMDIIGSVTNLLYNEELTIDNTYNKATNEKFGDDLKNRILESVEFITVHYTGSMASGDTAEAIAKYFAKPLSSVKTSIHYTTGNDGIYRGMDEVYRAAHAGDDGSLETVAKFEWLDTPVNVLPTDPKFPVVTITKNATYAINGRDTGIKVPKETKFGRGYVTDSKWLNDLGLAVNIKDGKYQLGTSWWCYTQVWEGRICSNGGNRNSIGIESCVNKGSDLWYTWHKTAMLCADIMNRHNLDITRVKGHHFFSAKVCPQPMLENDWEIWWEFLDMVEAEYAKLTKCGEYQFTFTTNSPYVNNKGRIIKQDLTPVVTEYTVTITNGSKTETITLGSILEGTYNK